MLLRLVGLLLLVGYVGLQAGPALAQGTPPPFIQLTPDRGSPGVTRVTVSGRNFPVNNLVNVTFDGISMGVINSGGGVWSHQFTVPVAPGGIHTVEADFARAASIAILLILCAAIPLIVLQRGFLVDVRRSL